MGRKPRRITITSVEAPKSKGALDLREVFERGDVLKIETDSFYHDTGGEKKQTGRFRGPVKIDRGKYSCFLEIGEGQHKHWHVLYVAWKPEDQDAKGPSRKAVGGIISIPDFHDFHTPAGRLRQQSSAKRITHNGIFHGEW
ncbi:MAG: hypothetical protein RJQ07_02655 [Pseudomonadales bacterium]